MSLIRQPAVAGSFYPADPKTLDESVSAYLAEVGAGLSSPAPKALIVPHAGYVYSGPIAASAFVTLRDLASPIERVLLLGPSHRVPLRGLAATEAEVFATPLGPVPIDREAIERVLHLPQVKLLESAHAFEHSLEVQLPFLKKLLPEFALAPFAVGDASAEEVAEVLETLWGGEETLIVVSSDLSHYYDYATARRMDAETSRAIESLDPEALGSESACGRVPVRGLLLAAKRHGLRARTLDLRNSGDTAGSRDRVVGYGAYVFA
jgi:AmmeMemoRadiSam system protein B